MHRNGRSGRDSNRESITRSESSNGAGVPGAVVAEPMEETCDSRLGIVENRGKKFSTKHEESLILAEDDTGQTGPSPIPRFGDGNRSEEKECKLL